MIDFSSYAKPTFTVRLRGADSPTLRLTPPPVELVDELKNVGTLLPDAGGGDRDALAAIYAIAAALMNCNRDGIPIQPEDITASMIWIWRIWPYSSPDMWSSSTACLKEKTDAPLVPHRRYRGRLQI